MLTLGPGQKPIVMPHYPHLLAEDIDVWSKYLVKPIAPILRVWYDVRVGAPVKLGSDADETTHKIAAGITRKRIDVICRVGGGYWVVEIKPYASMLALGQVVSYHRLFVEEYRPDGETWPVIVCDAVDEDLLSEFDAMGVAVIVND